MRKSIYMIRKNDLIDCAKLISKGYSLQESLRIIGNYDFILTELSKGSTIEQFIQFKRDTFSKTLYFFIKISSFDQAVLSAFEYETFTRNLKNNWIKEISYPILLVTFTCLVYLFFNTYIYPQLQSLILNQDRFILNHILTIILRIYIFVFLNIFIIILVYFLFIRKNEHYYSMIYDRLVKIPVIRKLISYDYAMHSLVLMKRGISTKQVFDSLLLLKNNRLLSIPLKSMIDSLHQGKEMNLIIDELKYFDFKFKKFYKIGYYSQNLESSLSDYCIYQEEEFKKYLKNSSYVLCISSYVFVAIFIISIYQMLLVPLEMIQQF